MVEIGVKWYNIKRFMGEKTQENLQMGYSAAYPTGAERCLFKVSGFGLGLVGFNAELQRGREDLYFKGSVLAKS